MAASSAFEKVTVPAGLSTVATPEALEGTPGVAEGAEGPEGAEVGTGDALPPIGEPPFASFDSGAFDPGVERSFGIWKVLSDEDPGPAFVPGVTFFSAGDANDAVAPSFSFSFAAASLASYGSTNPPPFFTEWSQPMKLEVNAGCKKTHVTSVQ